MNRLLLFLLFLGMSVMATAQHIKPKKHKIDSTYTVALPPDYLLPFDTAFEVVPAALFVPGESQWALGFDTTMAVNLEEVMYDESFVPTIPNELLKDRLSCIQKDIPLNFHPRVRVFVDYFTIKKREFTKKMLAKQYLYFPLYEKIFAEYGVPEELKYLSIIESAFNPRIQSRMGAVGLWQFMPRTGKMFGLRQDQFVDERMDPEKSTRAAARYLKQLHDFFGDWELAIAAYNCGPGNIKKAQRKSGQYHFWDIYEFLPQETRSYLPQLVAMMYVMNYAHEHNMVSEHPQYPIPHEEVYISQSVDLDALAQQLDVCAQDLKDLNPELKKGYLPSSMHNYALRIPSARLMRFLEQRGSLLEASGPHAAKKPAQQPELRTAVNNVRTEPVATHVVKRGESIGLIAKKYKTSVQQIKQLNNLRSDHIVPGQKLRVKSTGSKSVSTAQTVPPSSSGTGITYHVVRTGETLSQIAATKGVSVEELKKINDLRSHLLKPGQKLKIRQ